MCSSITTNVLTFQICVSKGPVEQWGSLAVSWEILCFNLVESISHSVFWLFATPWTVAHQAPPSMGFSRQEYWRGFPFPSPGDIPNPWIEPESPLSPALQVDLLSHQGSLNSERTDCSEGLTKIEGPEHLSGDTLYALCISVTYSHYTQKQPQWLSK